MNTFSQIKRKQKHSPPVTHHSPPSYPVAQASSEQASPLTSTLGSALFALPLMGILGVIFLLIGSAVAWRSPNPHALIPPLSLVALGLTCILGGLIVARQRRGRPLLGGLLCGLLFTALTWCLTFAVQDTVLPFPSPWLWVIRLGMVLLTLVGAKLGMGRR